MNSSKEIVLVDMDGVLMDWTAGFYTLLAEHSASMGVDPSFLPDADRIETFYIAALARTAQEQALIAAVMADDRLYAMLEPLPGAVNALNEVAERHEVFILTTPDPANRACTTEKAATLTTFFGGQWAKRLILAHDKTIVTGRILIDDKPNIKGLIAGRQAWQQVIYTQPYNRAMPGPRLDSWDGWASVIEPLLGREVAA